MTRLYYEAHITVEPNEEVPYEAFAARANSFGWRPSRFDEDSVDEYHKHWFASYRDSRLRIIKRAVLAAVSDFGRRGGLNVVRWKIEETVLDSKSGDALDDLS